ncbi:hypothetical protein BDN67DRAFT_971169 [Paxillus ammoniavirescens]|nr:hypothetical protein BDN67DRAFT_971169 [Paxillus ammoniavirescens]
MHSATASCACASSMSACTSSSPSSESTSVTHSCPRHASSIPVSKRNGADDADNFVNANAPQCCHCGWRGSHSPSCPFR